MEANSAKRLKSLEDQVSIIEYTLDSCRPLLKLAKDSESVPKIQDQISFISKQTSDLTAEHKETQTILEEAKHKLEETQEEQENYLKQELAKRQKASQDLNAKLGKLETHFKEHQEENYKALQELKQNLASHIQATLSSTRESLTQQHQKLKDNLEEAKLEAKNQLQVMTQSQQQCQDKLLEFESAYKDFLSTPSGSSSGKTELVKQCNSMIESALKEFNSFLEQRLQSLSSKYNSELAKLRQQIEDMHNWVKD